MSRSPKFWKGRIFYLRFRNPGFICLCALCLSQTNNTVQMVWYVSAMRKQTRLFGQNVISVLAVAREELLRLKCRNLTTMLRRKPSAKAVAVQVCRWFLDKLVSTAWRYHSDSCLLFPVQAPPEKTAPSLCVTINHPDDMSPNRHLTKLKPVGF